MYQSDSGIEELLRRLGPPGGADSHHRDAAASDEADHSDDDAAWSIDSFEHDSGAPGGSVSTSPYSIGVEWLAEQMRLFVDLHPDWEDAVGSFASYLARADDTDD